jgi:hypothetical protein
MDFAGAESVDVPIQLSKFLQDNPLVYKTMLWTNKAQVVGAHDFLAYIDGMYIPKLPMWFVGNKHNPQGSQDTNATIKSYHGNMKARLKASQSHLMWRRVKLLIHNLTHGILKNYKYN